MTRRIYRVSQITGYLKNLVTSDPFLVRVQIEGELSNCKYHSLGHIYFTLKDETSSMPCVMFRSAVESGGAPFRLQNGQKVIVTGSVGLYERDGRIEVYARKIALSDDGIGKLNAAYEKLKEKLYEEGLFDFERKKPVPKYPRAVGIVTAPTGAAIQDICNIARRRNPYVQLILYPAKVQGEGAAETICAGIRRLDEMGVDTIIIGRGGGSMEDLWAFNEESVARAIAASHTPVISGTGHETDTTIADYAADLRAPTPSAAAELAIPDVMSVIRQVQNQRIRLDSAVRLKISNLLGDLQRQKTLLESRKPENTLRSEMQRLDSLYEQMQHTIAMRTEVCRRNLIRLTGELQGLSPTARLMRGFGYLEQEREGKKIPLDSAANVKPGELLRITLHDGRIMAEVKKTERLENGISG